jgi:predicted outer membrane repeat protein
MVSARLLVGLVAFTLATLVLSSGGRVTPALAATGHVTNCTNSDPGSLRAVVAAATSGDTIVFDLDCTGASAIVLTSTILISGKTLTIDGSGHVVTISGNDAVRLFLVQSTANLTLVQLTLTHGSFGGGAAVTNSGILTLRRVTLSANSASANGGAISSAIGTLTVEGSTFEGNTAQAGGAINVGSGTATIRKSTFTGNSALTNLGGDGDGGAIRISSVGILTTTTIERSTFSGNSAARFGGAIANTEFATLTVRNSTLSGNSAANGGGIANVDFPPGGTPTATLENDTLSGNSATGSGGGIINNAEVGVANTIVTGSSGSNCAGTITDNGNNLQFGDTTCGFTLTADPLLGGLGDNGGPTQTMKLGEDSPAIGAASATLCQSAGIGNVDQRGAPRHADTRGVCDIGAYDTIAGPPSGATTLIDRNPSKIAVGGSTATITVRARDAGGNRLRIGGATVTLQTTLGTLSDVTDNHDGSYTATLTSGTLAGKATVSGAIDGNAITDTAGVDFAAGPPAGLTTTISSNPSRIPADGVSTSTITVRAYDQYGNPLKVGGANVQLNTDAGSLGSVTDLGNGKYTAVLTSANSPALATIGGTIDGDPIAATTTVRFL